MSKQITKIEEVRNSLTKMQDQFKAALPSHIPPQKFIRVAMTALQLNPKLLECDRRSLYGELIKCSQDGLLPDGSEAAVIPYGNKATYQPMVKGLCKRARNSGEISSMDAQVVYENDEYDAWTDEKGPHFKHRKARANRGPAILTYAYAITKDGGFYFEEITEEEMAAIANCSKGKDSPWKGPFKDEMKRKSAIKRLCKYKLPSSADLDTIIERDNEINPIDEAVTTAPVTEPIAEEPEPAPEPKKSKSLADAMGVKNEASKVEVVEHEEPPI